MYIIYKVRFSPHNLNKKGISEPKVYPSMRYYTWSHENKKEKEEKRKKKEKVQNSEIIMDTIFVNRLNIRDQGGLDGYWPYRGLLAS
jgi:hypothetical protein